MTGILLLRLSMGAMWLSHALLKLWVFTLPGTAQFFEGAGLPGWLAYPVFIAEFFGGLAILFNVKARHVALGLLPILLGAALVHAPNGWVFSNQGGGWEYPAFLSIATLVLWLLSEAKEEAAWATR